MYTRLYTQMLSRYHWAEAVESFISVHDESALLGIDGACDADYVQDLIKARHPNLYLHYRSYLNVSKIKLHCRFNLLHSI